MDTFNYLQPKTIEEASNFLNKFGKNGMPYSGGTDALVLLKDDIENPENVVNLKMISGLDKIEYKKGTGLKIGALVKIKEIAEHPEIKSRYKVLSEAAGEIASPQLRNMGTLGGNLCQRPRCAYFREDFHCLRKGGDMCYAFAGENKYHAVIGGGPCYIIHPSDMAVALSALDAKVEIFSEGKTKELPIQEFFILPEEDYTKENILKPGEVVTGVAVPDVPADFVSSYFKFKERAVWDFAVVSVALAFRKSGSKIVNGKTAFGGVAPKAWVDDALNSKLKNLSNNENEIESVVQTALKDADPLEMNGYKLPLVRNILKRMLIDLSA